MDDYINGNHIGFVINDQDPENRSRVQVFIPSLSNTLIDSWNDQLGTDKSFKTVDGTFTPDILRRLKNVLPWSEKANLSFGGGTSAPVNSKTGPQIKPEVSLQDPNSSASQSPKTDPNTAAGKNVTPIASSADGDPPQKQDAPASTDGKKITAFTTEYSFGVDVGGPDLNHDSNTNKGFGNSGYQNLGPGAAATNDPNLPNGTVLYNSKTGEKVMIVDTSGSDTAGNVDVWVDPTQYKNSPYNGTSMEWTVVGKASSYPKTNQELQQQLADFPGTVPQGQSAADWIASGNLNTDYIAQNQTQGPQTSDDHRPVQMQKSGIASLPNTGVKGFISKPAVGSKVWVFFHGGDPQKPVYFASVLEANASPAGHHV